LLYVVNLRALAARAGIQSISKEGGQVVVRLMEGLKVDRRRLGQSWQGLKIGTSQLRLDMALLGRKWRKVLQVVVEALASLP
jgi:hypothetical protein